MTTGRKDALGLPLLEVALLLLFSAVFAALLARQISYYGEVAEKTAVDITVRQMRSALQLEQARQLVQDGGRTLRIAAGDNPMRLVTPPENYQGEFAHISPTMVRPGCWAFDRGSRALIYRPRYSAHLQTAGSADLAFLKFVLESKHTPSDQLENADILKDVRLTSVQPYRWF